jgi:branched-chain amino acid transport system substrate-binding protein
MTSEVELMTKLLQARTLLLLVAVALFAAACGGGEDPPAAQDPPADDGGTADADDDGAADEPQGDPNEGVPGITADAIKLGTTLPITGPAAVAGEGLVAGINIAIEEVNANGGIDGRTVELVALDDGFDPPRLVANARRLIEEEGIYAFASPAGSQALPGIWDFVDQAGTIVWGPVSPQDPNRQPVYILGPGRGEQLRICTDYAAEQGLTRVALIGQDNELGEEGNGGVEAGVAANGLEYVAFERVEVLSQEISSAVLNVRDAGAEAIMLATDNTQASLIMQRVDELGMDVMLCADNGGGGTGGPNTVTPAGASATGFIGALQQELPTNTDNPAVAHWRGLAEGYTGQGSAQNLSNFSLQTYYYTRALFEVLDRLDGDYRYENFNRVAESLQDDPLDLGAIPRLACGPLPDGHSCASGAALAQYDAGTETWTVIRDFQPPKQ